MIQGSGSLISDVDEEGNDLPFLTTKQILTELQRFGFYVKYDVKSNLPMNIITFLATIDNLGFDKITKVCVRKKNPEGSNAYSTETIVMKSAEHNDDLLTFGCKISREKFNQKLEANTIMNVTNEKDMKWDWLTYMANISDLLDENIDPTDDFENDEDLDEHDLTPYVAPNSYYEPISDEHVPMFEPVEQFTPYTDSQEGTEEG